MPSRQPDPPLPPVEVRHHRHHVPPFLLPLAAASAALTLLLLIAIIFRKLAQRRIALADLNQPRRFSYSALRRATCSFSPSSKLGQGGFGSVYRAEFPGSSLPLAVKVMDSGSLQGDREFHNELALAPQINGCDRIVSLLGFSSHRRGSRLLVYELMPNGSLQDALLDRRCSELMTWSRRFAVAIDVARGLLFLHVACDPPIIHGDIKPSNILLDAIFSAKIADFGLARAKTHDLTVQIPSPDPIVHQQQQHHHHQQDGTDEGSATESMTTITTTTIFEDGGNGNAILVERSPDEASNSEILEKAVSASEANFNFNNDKVSSESGRRKSRWRKQDNGGASDSGSVKDYVMEWIGSEVKKERPKSNWIASDAIGQPTAKRKKKQRRPEWWPSLDVERIRKKNKSRPAREWWREEFCDELSKKKKKNKKRIAEAVGGSDVGEQWWQREIDEVELQDKRKKKKKTRSRSRSSVDWWMDGLSGEFRLGRRRSLDGIMGGDISKSGGISSTPSMRGTVCYVAPEYGGGGAISEMCDVYSYGVLLLVIVSGRRPLQVTASPMSEFERANLISWTRHLARRGKLLDLVDPVIQGLDREQALLCITIALLCLQRSPSQRPTMKEIVGMLSGECEPPHLPLEFSPSPPSGFPYKSGKKPGKSR